MSSGAQPYSEEGYALMGATFEVHNEIGGGLAEEIYQQILEIELELRDIPFRSKQEIPVFYKERELKKHYIPDLVALEKVIVELKSVSALLPEHEGQLMNYMRVSKSPKESNRLPDQLRPDRKT